MALRNRKLQKVVYEEKPQCHRCGATIIGVVPRWYDEKPLCRECVFELEELARKPGARNIVVDEVKPPLTPEQKARRLAMAGGLVIVFAVLFFRAYTIAPLLAPDKPLRHGVAKTDALTDQCVAQLWRLSRTLQDGQIPGILPLCPKSSRQYVVDRTENDTVISCPTPESHGLASLSVSRSNPVPNAVPQGAR